MAEQFTIGIVAPSAVVPGIELGLGVKRMEKIGFRVKVHRQCGKCDAFFAGADEDRAKALFEYALDPHVHVLWSARGGYGAARLLPLLDRLSARKRPPRGKLLVGYSDTTALMEYVRSRWGWHTLHAPMPGLKEFSALAGRDWDLLWDLVIGPSSCGGCSSESSGCGCGGNRPSLPEVFGEWRLKSVGGQKRAVRAEIVGGNLAVWASMMGTPYAPSAQGKILFFEEVGEYLYRVDRMVQQIDSAGGFRGVKAIVLGDFHHCDDSVMQVSRSPRGKGLKPLRPVVGQNEALRRIFGEIGKRNGIPVLAGLPAGHGEGHLPVPMGGEFELSKDGRLRLLSWGWTAG